MMATMHGREGDGTPHAPVSVVWSSRGRYWAVTVERCPLCGKRHHHGGGDGPEPALGDRVAHCDEPGGYELVETAASIAARTLPYGCADCAVETAQGANRRSVVDGKPVRATRLKAGFPKAYAIQLGDGPILGHAQRTPNGASEAYVGVVPSDGVGAQVVGTHRTMRYAIAQLVREATASSEPSVNPEVSD